MLARRIVLLLTMVLVAALMAVGCGDDTAATDGGDAGGGSASEGSGSQIETPAPLEAGGEFRVCTDVPYPPAEFLEGDEFVGYEIDLMNEVAERIGTTAEYEATGFDAIIPALQSDRCDAIISSMNVTEERQEQVDFVEYMEIGQSLMVQAGESQDVQDLDSLSGKSVAVQGGTTLKTALDEKSKELQDAGEDGIDVQTFPDAGAAAAALRSDRVDVFFADSPVVAEYVNDDPDSFAFAGEPIDPLAVGIALRKEDDELQDAVQEAVDSMYEDGTMEQILSQWNVADFMLADKAGGSSTEESSGDATDTDAGSAEGTTETESEDETATGETGGEEIATTEDTGGEEG